MYTHTHLNISHEFFPPLRRLKLFAQRQKRIELLNAQPNRSWTAGVSPLADYTAEADGELELFSKWMGWLEDGLLKPFGVWAYFQGL